MIGVSHDERTLAALWEGTPADAETLLKQLQSTEAKAAATVVWFEDKLRSNQLCFQLFSIILIYLDLMDDKCIWKQKISNFGFSPILSNS